MKALCQKLFISLCVCFMLYSCTDDYFEFDEINTSDWRPELAIPLIKSSLSLNDIVVGSDTNGLIQENENGVFELIYDGRVFSTPGEELIVLPNQNFNESVGTGLSIPSSPTPITRIENFSTEINFDDNGSGIEVDSLLLNNGILILNVENDFQYDVDLKVTFRTFKNNLGETLVLEYEVPAATTPNGTAVRSKPSISLASYNLNMSEAANGSKTFNTIPVDIEATFTIPSNTPSQSDDELRLRGTISNIDFKEFDGYIGQRSLPLDEDSINVTVFKNFIDANFFLSNPRLDITILNSFGIPSNLSFGTLKAFNPDRSPSDIQIQLPSSAQPINLEYPTRYGVDSSVISLDTNSSNIDDVISFLLKEIVYEATADFNPVADRNIRNFVTDTSQIGINVFLKLPFSGYSSGFVVQDTIDFSFDSSDDIDDGSIRLITSNGFPIAGDLQIIFTDSSFNTIDSLFDEGKQVIIEPAFVDNRGDVIGKRDVLKDFDIGRERLESLRKSKFALLRVGFNTVNAASQEVVSFRPGYEIDITVGLKARILID